MPRTLADLEAAARRVDADGPIRAGKAADMVGVSPATIVSWIVQGRRGVYLDGKKAGGFWTSEAALCRFSAQRLLREAPRLEPPRQRDGRAQRAGEALAAKCGRA